MSWGPYEGIFGRPLSCFLRRDEPVAETSLSSSDESVARDPPAAATKHFTLTPNLIGWALLLTFSRSGRTSRIQQTHSDKPRGRISFTVVGMK